MLKNDIHSHEMKEKLFYSVWISVLQFNQAASTTNENTFYSAVIAGSIITVHSCIMTAQSLISKALLSPCRHRMPKTQWWLNLRLMLKMLAKYQTSFNEYVTGEIEHVTRRSLSIDTGF